MSTTKELEFSEMISFFIQLKVPFRAVPAENKLFLLTNYGEQMLAFKEDEVILYYMWNKENVFKYDIKEDKDHCRMLLKNLAYLPYRG